VKENPLRTADAKAIGLQSDRMPCVKPARRPINRLPARRPFAGVTLEWRGVESQAGNNSERVTLARIDRDPFPRTALAVAAELGRA